MKIIYFIVAVTGAAVLALEILGTRVLAPFYGAGLFLWSALITTTLAALSLGYHLGGRWADRQPSLSRLSLLVGVSGFWTLLIPWINSPILSITEAFGLRFAVMAASLLLFSPPLLLLGMVSPYAIKLKTTSLDEVGRTTGNVFAVSTVSSVVSALATGFFLVPNIGVNRLTVGIGASLLLASTVGFFTAKKKVSSIGVLAFTITCLGASVAFEIREAGSRSSAVVVQSPYGEIRVLDTDDGRHLLIDGGIHSLADTLNWQSQLEYVAVLEIPKYFYEKPGRMLLIGLGGASIVKSYRSDGWVVDAVEIDPAIVQIAKSHFGLRSDEAQVFTMDGRRFLHESDQTYDVILFDAFGSSSIPFHLITREAFRVAFTRLSAAGILAVNLEAIGWHDAIVHSVGATLKQEFKHVLALPIAEPPTELGNVILLARNVELQMVRELQRPYYDPEYRFSSAYWKVHAWDNQLEPAVSGVPIITDDLNAVDVWSESINYVSRRKLHEYMEQIGIGW